jgi:hypothetical protein
MVMSRAVKQGDAAGGLSAGVLLLNALEGGTPLQCFEDEAGAA